MIAVVALVSATLGASGALVLGKSAGWIDDDAAVQTVVIPAEPGETGVAPTAAVLVRRRADMAPIAAALREEGLPVEVVGLGGLLDEPEVADLVATLRVLAEPLSGTAAARLTLAAAGAVWARADPAAARLRITSKDSRFIKSK